MLNKMSIKCINKFHGESWFRIILTLLNGNVLHTFYFILRQKVHVNNKITPLLLVYHMYSLVVPI